MEKEMETMTIADVVQEIMTQDERRIYLIRELLKENPQYNGITVPESNAEQKRLLRALFNVRMPMPVSNDFLEIQDAYLQEEIRQKGITDIRDLKSVQDGIYLWKGDITTLRCGAIVNAANSQMLGCFCPNHGCIDNAIHTFAGIQLRTACAELMRQQGHNEPTGQTKITAAYNLPCDYVIHTVGPIVRGHLTKKEEDQLASCYDSCLRLAGENDVTSAGYTYAGERFQKYFSDFEEKYGFCDMYSGGFYNYDTLGEFWAFWSRYIYINRYMDVPKPVYQDLFSLVKEKEYFVLTTNVDHCFQKAGFDKERLFYTQGDYGLWQCSGSCCQKTYDNEKAVRQI